MKPSFEDQLKALETIVKALEQGELPLDDAMKKYQEGMQIANEATKRLDEAKAILKEMLENDQEVDMEDPEAE